MNSLNELLGDKADNLFYENKIETATQTIDLEELRKTIYSVKDQLDQILRTLNKKQTEVNKSQYPDINTLETGERIVEGVFNGENMVGSDGKEYTVPANYASKSKLVEGDMMKLTITVRGSFIFKQIGPIERKRLVGEVTSLGDSQFTIISDGKAYKVLMASISFFKGKTGDEAVILVPKDGGSDWAAVENIIHK